MINILVKILITFFLFLITSCAQNIEKTTFNKKTTDYKVCLNDANHNINKRVNINEDRINILQTDDTMIDFYNIENDIDQIKLSEKRNLMLKDCIKSRKKN